jgi:CHAT domain-containing protein
VRSRAVRGAARVLGALIVTGLAQALWIAPVAALGGCTFTVNGRDLDALSEPRLAADVPSGSVIHLRAEAPTRLGAVTVTIDGGPFPAISQTETGEASTSEGELDLSQQPLMVQGLFRVTATAPETGCPASVGWVKLTGGLPFLTLPGAIGAVVAVGGAVSLLVALRAALLGRGRIVLAAIGGVLAGLGALVVAQQAGVTQIDGQTTLTWSGVPAVIGSVVQRGVRAAAGPPRSAEGRAGGGIRTRWRRAESGWPGDPASPTATSGGAAGPASRGGAPPMPAPEPTIAEPPAGAAEPEPTMAEPPARAAEPDLAMAKSLGKAASTPVADEGAAAPAGAGLAGDTPRVSYAHLDAPGAVVAAEPFDLEVGLAEKPAPDVDASPIVRPDWVMGEYTLTVQLLAEGFERIDPADDPWRLDLPVTLNDFYPTRTIQLRATAIDGPQALRSIRVVYSVGGQAIGVAKRDVKVVDSHASLAAVEPSEAKPPLTLSTPQGETAPDLTITIETHLSQSSGQYTWQMLTPHRLAEPVSSNPLLVDLGQGAPDFLSELFATVKANEGQPFLKTSLTGQGRKISAEVPPAFWRVLRGVIDAVAPTPPTIQILSAEAHIPWELAVLPDDFELIDPSAPPMLAAQTSVGRWVVGPPPDVPPPATLAVERIAVVSGVYPGGAQLEQAEEEAQELEDRWGAEPVDARADQLLQAVEAAPPYDILHFAVHGTYGADAQVGGILLADGAKVDESVVLGFRLAARPLVFLNACQVGSGSQVLGDYAGLAAAFLRAGATAVIAPLWSVDDVAARQIGLRVYERLFQGVPPADALRQERASFMTSADTSKSTFLAYQFYGHPALKVVRVT